MHTQTTHPNPPATAAPTFGDLAGWVTFNAYTLAATAVVHAGERAYRVRKPNRRPDVAKIARAAVEPWPAFVAWYYVRETWRGIPGPWPVKLIIFVAVVAEPGPYGEIALAAFAKWNGKRKARKAAQS